MPKPPFGLVAGSGNLPAIVTEELHARDRSVVACFLTPSPADELRDAVETGRVFKPENFGAIPDYFVDAGVDELVMVGSVDRSLLFEDDRLDAADDVVRSRVEDTRFNRDESLLRTAVEILEGYGLTVRGLDGILGDQLTPAGHLAGPELRSGDEQTLETLVKVGPFLSDHEVGQSLLGKRQAVVAVEAAEGTNETIKRAGELAGSGTVMLKLARTDQDFRLDVPVVGSRTLRNLAAVDANLLAVEAERTLWIERDECRSIAEESEITVLGWVRE